jgi:DNA-binding transcriptional MerR regulator
MTDASVDLRQISDFARETGVTVRALRLYDRLELLKPAAVTAAGYRLYGAAQLERLEQIAALRFVGFSLEQIKELLDGSHLPLAAALEMQRNLVARQKRRLESVLAALDEARLAIDGNEPGDPWATLRNVMEAFTVSNDWEWTKRYYSPRALERIEENRTSMGQGAIEQSQRDWSALIAEVEDAAMRGIDPRGDEARTLAARWRALIAQFTRGNAEIQRGLEQLWNEAPSRPSSFQRPWNDAADAFIKAAMDGGE